MVCFDYQSQVAIQDWVRRLDDVGPFVGPRVSPVQAEADVDSGSCDPK